MSDVLKRPQDGFAVIAALALLLGCQLAGELVARGLSLPVPGPVLGLALLLALLAARPSTMAVLRPTTSVILANLSLLFVPAGVGVIANIDILADAWAPLVAVLVVSTILSMLAAVGTFLLVRNLTGEGGE